MLNRRVLSLLCSAAALTLAPIADARQIPASTVLDGAWDHDFDDESEERDPEAFSEISSFGWHLVTDETSHTLTGFKMKIVISKNRLRSQYDAAKFCRERGLKQDPAATLGLAMGGAYGNKEIRDLTTFEVKKTLDDGAKRKLSGPIAWLPPDESRSYWQMFVDWVSGAPDVLVILDGHGNSDDAISMAKLRSVMNNPAYGLPALCTDGRI